MELPTQITVKVKYKLAFRLLFFKTKLIAIFKRSEGRSRLIEDTCEEVRNNFDKYVSLKLEK